MTALAFLAATAMADPATYLQPIVAELEKAWPDNRAVTIVFHGHSVPAGYFATPNVQTFDAYPHLVHLQLKQRFPRAVINVIVTAVGGENSVSGAARFESQVLNHRPDLIVIDYGLNDRPLDGAATKAAWTQMIQWSKKARAKVLLVTPTPDHSTAWTEPDNPLARQAAQIRSLATDHGVGMVDAYARFKKAAESNVDLNDLMSQSNHPNRRGHELVAELFKPWFPEPFR